jgi:hypothetical protein
MTMRLHVSFAVLLLIASTALAGPTYTDPEKVDEGFAYVGEYVGKVGDANDPATIAVQVIALGKGKFRAVAYQGGLPGEGWDPNTEKVTVDGELSNGQVVFAKDEGKGIVQGGKITLNFNGSDIGTLEKVERKSPTLGAKPPEGAIVLFDGTSADAFVGGKLTDDKLLQQGCTSKQKFGSHKLHIEFRTPYQPEDNGQGRGNSGVYLQGRYEVQVLDSFGLSGEQNECGGVYSVAKPNVNMCLPPLAWQTYDIEYTAAKYDGDKLVANPRITVKHNGETIHNNVELPGNRNTTAAPVAAGKEPGPLYLQDHGNPVRFRNIWVVEVK